VQIDSQEHARKVRFLVHELNNQLFVIGGHCELLALHVEAASRAQSDLDAITMATERAAALAAEMRSMVVAHADAAVGAEHADVDAH
jgi:signal transduction histidine kinase